MRTKNVLSGIKAITGKNVILKYVRGKNRKPIGVVIAIDSNVVGWSKCRNGQKWNAAAGIMMAMTSALSRDTPDSTPANAPIFRQEFIDMQARSRSYYHAPKPHKSSFVKK